MSSLDRLVPIGIKEEVVIPQKDEPYMFVQVGLEDTSLQFKGCLPFVKVEDIEDIDAPKLRADGDKCDILYKNRENLKNLTEESILNRIEKKSPFKCVICRDDFLRNADLRRHLHIHSGERPFKCRYCDKVFAQHTDLKRHLLTHSGEKPFRCHRCDRDFNLKSNLTRHISTHFGDKPFKCGHCEKEFHRKTHLARHIPVHEIPFKCKHCNECFYLETHLMAHLRTHSHDNDFKCTHYDKVFKRVASLRNHKVAHSCEKPFKCDECKKEFLRGSSLKKHKMVQSNIKNFICSICDKEFYLKATLDRHRFGRPVKPTPRFMYPTLGVPAILRSSSTKPSLKGEGSTPSSTSTQHTKTVPSKSVVPKQKVPAETASTHLETVKEEEKKFGEKEEDTQTRPTQKEESTISSGTHTEKKEEIENKKFIVENKLYNINFNANCKSEIVTKVNPKTEVSASSINTLNVEYSKQLENLKQLSNIKMAEKADITDMESNNTEPQDRIVIVNNSQSLNRILPLLSDFYGRRVEYNNMKAMSPDIGHYISPRQFLERIEMMVTDCSDRLMAAILKTKGHAHDTVRLCSNNPCKTPERAWALFKIKFHDSIFVEPMSEYFDAIQSFKTNGRKKGETITSWFPRFESEAKELSRLSPSFVPEKEIREILLRFAPPRLRMEIQGLESIETMAKALDQSTIDVNLITTYFAESQIC